MKMKHYITGKNDQHEDQSPFLEKLRLETRGTRVPAGYFDSLGPRIVDKIKKQDNRSFLKQSGRLYYKPHIWAPVFATMLLAIVLVFVIPAKKETGIPAIDELATIQLAYDDSYAEEAMLSEYDYLDNEIAKIDINYYAASSLSGEENELTDKEITDYLEENVTDPDILTEH